MHALLAVFIPLFVSIDAVGLIPVFLSLTSTMTVVRRREVTFEAVSVGLLVCIGFMLLGHAVFRFLGITEADFRIAGGVILLVLSVINLLIPGKPAVDEHDGVGVFPLAMPLIVGPATLTATLVLANRAGYALTSLSLAINFAILLAALLAATQLSQLIGKSAMRAMSKIVVLMLAAIAVNLVRTGIADVLSSGSR